MTGGDCPKCDQNDGWTGCLGGVWYGPCDDPNCGGLCDDQGNCDCECHQ